MDTTFFQVQEFGVDGIPSWSTFSPELNWSSFPLEGEFGSTLHVLISIIN